MEILLERICIKMELERISPEAAGIPSEAILAFLDGLEKKGVEMHSMMLLRHGKVCAQGWWHPYAPQTPHIMFSFSKSLTSTAIGFACQEGLLSLEDRLVDLFPEKIPEQPSENLEKATIRHLLMMGCGHKTEIPRMGIGEEDWIKTFLHHPFIYEPGTKFMYNTAGTNLLSAILQKKTGQGLTAFLRPRLIEPLGLTDIHCATLEDGTEMGGAGYSLTTQDMARFIQFVANRGQWEGKQLLNPAWFDLATSKQIENENRQEDPHQKLEWAQGYGFQFWRCSPPGVFRADGAFGQYGVVFSQRDAVLVCTSVSLCMEEVLSTAWETLLPAMEEAPLAENKLDAHRLAHRLQHLHITPMLGMRNPGAQEALNGATYCPDRPCPGLEDLVGGEGHFIPRGTSLSRLGFAFTQNQPGTLTLWEGESFYNLALGMEGKFAVTEVQGIAFAACSRWRAANQLEVELRNTTCASGKRLLFTFRGATLTLTADSTLPMNGGLADSPLSPITFTLEEGENVNTSTKMYWEQ